MYLVYLFVGLGVGILLGALLQDRVRRDKIVEEEPSRQSDFVRLFKEAAMSLGKNESVSIVLTASKEDEDGEHFVNVDPKMIEQWRNN